MARDAALAAALVDDRLYAEAALQAVGKVRGEILEAHRRVLHLARQRHAGVRVAEGTRQAAWRRGKPRRAVLQVCFALNIKCSTARFLRPEAYQVCVVLALKVIVVGRRRVDAMATFYNDHFESVDDMVRKRVAAVLEKAARVC